MRHRIFMLMITLLITPFLFASVIHRDLQYLQTDKNIWELRSTDFRNDITTNLDVKLNQANFVVLFLFTQNVNTTYMRVSVNNRQYQNMESYIQATGINGFSLDLTEYLILGRNTITMMYEETNKRDERSWSFNISELHYVNFIIPQLPVTQTRSMKKNMSFSPDGRLIAYLTEDVNSSSIMVLNTDDNIEREVITSRATRTRKPDNEERFYSYAPCWSRDGHYLYFISTKDGHPQIYRIYIDYDGIADMSSIVQLTSFHQEYITNLLYSPFEERIYYSRTTDGYLRLYYTDNPHKMRNQEQFTRGSKLVSNELRHEYTPDISYDGQYLAFSYEGKESEAKIEIRDRENHTRLEHLAIPGRDILYPSWSPTNNILAYYTQESIFIYDMGSRDKPAEIGFNRRPSNYILKPVWDVNGKYIHYIKNDNNFSLNYININFDNLLISRITSYLDSQNNRDNREIAISPNMKFIAYISTQGGNHNIWLIERKGINDTSLVRFDTTFDTKIAWINPFNREKEVIGFSPSLDHRNSVYEIQNVKTGNYRFFLEDQEKYIKANSINPQLISYKRAEKKSYYIGRGFNSLLLPGWGQKRSYYTRKGNYFFRSLLGLAAIGAGSYLLEEHFFDKYNEANNYNDVSDFRTKTVTTQAYRKGIIFTGSLFYALNIVDAIFSKPDLAQSRSEKYVESYNYRRAMNNRRTHSYGKEHTGLADLKVITNLPETDIFLSDEQNNIVKYGTSGIDFNQNVHFTITDIEPGSYKLIGKHKSYHPLVKNVELEPYLAHYSVIEFTSKDALIMKNLLNKSIPGYYHFTNDEPTKGYAIVGLTALSLIGALVTNANANTQYNKYYLFDDANNIHKLTNYKDNYHTQVSYRNTLLGTFLLTYLYNIYDVRGK